MKIIINLASSQKVEKEIVTAFSAGTLTYVILDAAAVGNGGMPIVLVSKMDNQKLVKMTDQGEWQSAKENLKAIIAGNTMNYINMPIEINADDIFYTQLTIPVPSFDLIKNAYKPTKVEVNQTAPVMDTIEPASVESTPVVNVSVPEVEPMVAPIEVANTQETIAPTTPELNPIPSATEVSQINLSNVEPQVSPINEIMPTLNEEAVVPTQVEIAPVEEQIPTEKVNFADTKEMFMKACETMFDALVAKFQAELEKK